MSRFKNLCDVGVKSRASGGEVQLKCKESGQNKGKRRFVNNNYIRPSRFFEINIVFRWIFGF